MEICTTARDGVLIVKLAGILDSRAAGRLYTTMVDCVGHEQSKLVVDVSAVGSMTRAGIRGLIVAAKLMRPRGGDMRIAGAGGRNAIFLRNVGFNHLLKCDATVEASMATLLLRTGRTTPAATARTPANDADMRADIVPNVAASGR